MRTMPTLARRSRVFRHGIACVSRSIDGGPSGWPLESWRVVTKGSSRRIAWRNGVQARRSPKELIPLAFVVVSGSDNVVQIFLRSAYAIFDLFGVLHPRPGLLFIRACNESVCKLKKPLQLAPSLSERFLSQIDVSEGLAELGGSGTLFDAMTQVQPVGCVEAESGGTSCGHCLIVTVRSVL